VTIYRLAVIGMVIWDSISKVQIVWDMDNLFMGLVAITNMVAIGLLGKIAFDVLKDYVAQRKAGKDPVFHTDTLPGLTGMEAWETSPESELKEKSPDGPVGLWDFCRFRPRCHPQRGRKKAPAPRRGCERKATRPH
jgi:hypothetical protein